MTFTSRYARAYSDGNPVGDVCFSDVASDGTAGKGYFFGNENSTPVAQPSGNQLAAVLRGQAAGVITTYATTQSPVGGGVAANTTAESAALTVQSGSGAVMLPATTDLVYVNKPTAQAGLGVGNVRFSASNALRITFSNFTAAPITPTGGEVYVVVAIRGLPVISATLSPAAVPANTIAEQQFTITPATTGSSQGIGLPAGTLVQVNKPTAQAGLDIMGCRVVSNNVIGINFGNLTAAPITPTAAEVYTIIALAGLDAVNNDVFYGFNVGTIGAMGPGVVVTGGATTLTGVLATDMISGIDKPTAQAAATNAAIPSLANTVLTADTLTLAFFGVGTGYTPTASEVYAIRTARINPAAPLLLYSQTLTPVAVAANTTAEQTFTVTGLIAGTPVWVNPPSAVQNVGIVGCRVSAASTLAITFGNCSTGSLTPPVGTYTIGNFQAKSPGAGNSVYQACSGAFQRLGDLANALRNGLGPSGLNLHAGG